MTLPTLTRGRLERLETRPDRPHAMDVAYATDVLEGYWFAALRVGHVFQLWAGEQPILQTSRVLGVQAKDGQVHFRTRNTLYRLTESEPAAH